MRNKFENMLMFKLLHVTIPTWKTFKLFLGVKEMLIGERIFKWLEEKKMSQKEFSERTGISQSTISDWKHKKTNPTADKLTVICDVLQISLYELLSDTQGKELRKLDYMIVEKDSEDYKILEQFHTLGEQEKNRLRGYMEALKT